MKKIILNKGFTVVELLLYMGIMTVFLTVLTDIFSSVTNVRTESEIGASVSQDSNYLLSKLIYDIQRADSINIPTAAGLSSSTLELTIGGVTHTYAINSGDLILTNSFGNNNLNGFNTQVSNLQFSRIGSNAETVRIIYTVTSRQSGKQGTESKTVQTTVGLR